jgi:hypothetical protein
VPLLFPSKRSALPRRSTDDRPAATTTGCANAPYELQLAADLLPSFRPAQRLVLVEHLVEIIEQADPFLSPQRRVARQAALYVLVSHLRADRLQLLSLPGRPRLAGTPPSPPAAWPIRLT